MSERQILATNRSIKVESCNRADEEVLNHIKSAILGTPGKVRYKLTRIENKLEHINEIYFVLLRMRSFLLGSIGFCKRTTRAGEKEYSSWYIRYFYIHAPFRSKKQEKEKYRNPSKGSNLIRDAALPYMKEPALLKPEEYDKDAKNLVYGYIESLNFRSLNFSEQAGAVTTRKFRTLVFSRLTLKKGDPAVRRISKEEIPVFRKTLREFYNNYTFYTDENMFFDGNYFVYVENGEIQAGLQVHPETWKIIEMPGGMNRALLKMLPVVPYVRKIFNPGDFRFLALEGIYFREGKETLLERMIESVCKHFNTHFAFIWADSQSEMLELLKKNVNFGTIGNSMDSVEVDIRVTFNNFTEEEKREFFEKPAYISAFDSV